MAEIIPAYNHMDQIRTMFRNYITWIGVPQNFEELERELAALPGPGGTVLSASGGGRNLGLRRDPSPAQHPWRRRGTPL